MKYAKQESDGSIYRMLSGLTEDEMNKVIEDMKSKGLLEEVNLEDTDLDKEGTGI